MRQLLPRAWYQDAPWLRLLQPLASLYGWLGRRHREEYRSGRKQAWRAGVPVVVIGNLVAGGTGKTPLTLALCRYLQAQGLKPAIITRGYGGNSPAYPLLVTCDTLPAHSGDEALLFALNCEVPVVADPHRSRGVRFLEQEFAPDVILCDDGLQHHALARDIEIVVVDGSRGFGNGRLLPAGPLREGVERLLEVDHVVINGEQDLLLPEGAAAPSRMQIRPGQLVNLVTGESLACREWLQRYGSSTSQVHALAGIGNPERFFATLRNEGFAIIAHPFPDHYRFTAADICFADPLPVLMTEKDAVKCLPWADARHWCLKVDAVLPDIFLQAVLAKVLTLRASRAAQGLHP